MFPAALNLLLAALLSLGGSPLGCACGVRGCAKPGAGQACARANAPDCCAACAARPARWTSESGISLPVATARAMTHTPAAPAPGVARAPAAASAAPPGSPPGLPLRV